MERGRYDDGQKAREITFSELCDRYWLEVGAKMRSMKAIRSRLTALKNGLGPLKMASITSQHIAVYRKEREKFIGPSSLRKELGLAGRVIDVAVIDWGLTLYQGNPVKKIRLPKEPSGRTRRIESREKHNIYIALKSSPQMQEVVEWAIETAMRREEISNMSFNDVNWNNKTIYIPHTKTDTPRTIPLSSRCIEILANRHDNLPSREVNIVPFEQSEVIRVFSIRPDSISQAFRRACTRAGIQDLHFHDLRHEAISRFFELGLSVPEVALISGHRDYRQLFRYTHLRAEDVAKKLN